MLNTLERNLFPLEILRLKVLETWKYMAELCHLCQLVYFCIYKGAQEKNKLSQHLEGPFQVVLITHMAINLNLKI